MEEFKKLGLSEEILKAIKDEKFESPTEIQRKTIPLVLRGKDVIAGSATGSGKTLAFGSGIIQNSFSGKGIQALILTPTRELAEQISVNLKKFSRYKKLNITSVYGGVAIEPQMKNLAEADIVVGTPGRILDHMNRHTIRLDEVKILVLDEADRMLDMGFEEDVMTILKACPKHKQTLLFSATLSTDLYYIADHYMKDFVEIKTESFVDPKKLKQYYYDVPDHIKFSLLVHFLKKEHSGLVMVFCNTRRNVDFVADNLKLNGINSIAIHGGFTQNRRTQVMDQFSSKETCVLVCTDVAARGLDIKGVSHIYNYDTPDDPTQYIHRIGRTARAGKEGEAITILGPRDYDNFTQVLKVNDIDIPGKKAPLVDRVKINIPENKKTFGQKTNYKTKRKY